MSDRADRNPSGSTTRDVSSGVSPTASPPGNIPQRTTSGIRSVTSPVAQGSVRAAGGLELPPLNRQSAASSETFLPPPTGRIAGVSSILNPSPQDDFPQNRRRKASQLESPTSSVQSLPSIAAATQGAQPISAGRGQSPSLQYGVPSERPPRRILTPRSPSLHRAASLGQLNQTSGTISAQQNPFPSSPHARAYTIEPGTSGAPPLPTPPAINRPGYGFPGATPSEAARRASAGTSRARGLSSSASPTTSYSSYSQLEQTSPAAQYVATSGGAMPVSQPTSVDASKSAPPPTGSGLMGYVSERQRPVGIPISSSGGQNVYQMMTLETTSGTVQLPVDVQAASRVADEKRRRNAGASARFRQRRKEKEKESSTTISRLEQQVKELGEDADFYRRERDIFQGILSTIPGCERHLQRPPSPRLRRSSIPLMSGHTGPISAQEQVQRSPEGRNVRRRTSTYSLPPPPPPPPPQHQLLPPGTSYQGGFAAPGYGAPLAPQPPGGTQPSRPESTQPSIGGGQMPQQQLPPRQPQLPPAPIQQQQLQGPPPVLQPPPQTGPWNPYPSERRQSGPSNRPQNER